MSKTKQYTLSLVAITIAAFGLTACQDKIKVPTVADYMHDIDLANKMKDEIHNNPAKYKNDPAHINAEQAALDSYMARGIGAPNSIYECWPKNEKWTTANTDHACLDRHGYKR